jgi:hypothetical protein
MSHDPHSNPNAGPGYETTDVHIAPITKFMVGLVMLMFLGMILGWLSFKLLDFKQNMDYADMKTTTLQNTRQIPTGPLLQVTNHGDLLDFRAEQAKDVSGHATWLDKNAKVVRLPIDRAIELISERGLPVFKGDVNAVSANQEKPKAEKPKAEKAKK